MKDFLEYLLIFLLGTYFGMIALAYMMDKNYQKFCPQCGHRFKNEEIYCQNDGAELLTIGG